MQQRLASSSRAHEDHGHVIDMPGQEEDESGGHRPFYLLRPSPSGRSIGDRRRPRSLAEKCLHAIPTIVLLCILILWWFSRPVNVVRKDGEIVAIKHVEFAVLASATSPIASVSQNITANDETEAYLNFTANIETESHLGNKADS